MKVERIEPIKLDKKNGIELSIIVAEKQLNKKAIYVKYLGGGSFGSAYCVTFDDTNKIVVKFLRAKNMVQKEVFDLKLLAKTTRVGRRAKAIFIEDNCFEFLRYNVKK